MLFYAIAFLLFTVVCFSCLLINGFLIVNLVGFSVSITHTHTRAHSFSANPTFPLRCYRGPVILLLKYLESEPHKRRKGKKVILLKFCVVLK